MKHESILNGATVVNSKRDPRMTFDPDLTPREAEALRTTWLPSSVRRDYPVAHTYWLTRASRGFSWHRLGRAPAREQLRFICAPAALYTEFSS